jgi:hypothetical protein
MNLITQFDKMRKIYLYQVIDMCGGCQKLSIENLESIHW